MKDKITKIFAESRLVQEATARENADAIVAAVDVIVQSIKKDGKVIVFGNGGSAADSQHIAAEFLGRFAKERRSIAAVALTTDTSAMTAIGNDYGFDKIFVRQMEGLGRKGDVALAISTSGNSANVIEAVKLAKKLGIKTIALVGNTGGQLAALADVKIVVPSKVTARIQESHICVAHSICELVEEQFC